MCGLQKKETFEGLRARIISIWSIAHDTQCRGNLNLINFFKKTSVYLYFNYEKVGWDRWECEDIANITACLGGQGEF